MGRRPRLPQGQGSRLSARIVDDATACPPCARAWTRQAPGQASECWGQGTARSPRRAPSSNTGAMPDPSTPFATKESNSASSNESAWRPSSEGGPKARQIGSHKDPHLPLPGAASARGETLVEAKLEPDAVAHHFTEAGLDDLAIEWWSKSGEKVVRQGSAAVGVRANIIVFSDLVRITRSAPHGGNNCHGSGRPFATVVDGRYLRKIGIGGASRHRPSHTTGHTGPYQGGSIELGLGRAPMRASS